MLDLSFFFFNLSVVTSNRKGKGKGKGRSQSRISYACHTIAYIIDFTQMGYLVLSPSIFSPILCLSLNSKVITLLSLTFFFFCCNKILI